MGTTLDDFEALTDEQIEKLGSIARKLLTQNGSRDWEEAVEMAYCQVTTVEKRFIPGKRHI